MSEENGQANAGRSRRGAVDYSDILGEDRRKRFNVVNRLRMRLIELGVSGDSVRDADILDEVRQTIREVRREFVLVSADEGVTINRSLGRLRLNERMSNEENQSMGS